MKWFFAVVGAKGTEFKLVDVTFDHAIDCKSHLQTIFRDFCFGDFGNGLIDFGTTIASAINVGEGAETIGLWITGGGRVDGFCEGQ